MSETDDLHGLLGPEYGVNLKPGKDIHVIACGRDLQVEQTSVVGVRWASRPDLGFPDSGYKIYRVYGNPPFTDKSEKTELGVYWLPKSDNWAEFRKDAITRKPAQGPYFPPADITEDNFGYLLPLVRLADPRTPAVEYDALIIQVAEFLGNPHINNASLSWQLWGMGSAPMLVDLLSGSASRSLLVKFYRTKAANFLVALSQRFEYAVLFGLATDDSKAPIKGSFYYVVDAAWKAESGILRGRGISDPKRASSQCATTPPKWVNSERLPGSVAHEAFSVIPAWTVPAEMLPIDSAGRSIPSDSLIPRPPSAFTGLTWEAPQPEPDIIGYGPVLYEVLRYHYGKETAVDLAVPYRSIDAQFDVVVEGEYVIRGDGEPHWTDLPGMPWPPLEGYYEYKVLGVNLLGVKSLDGPNTILRHFDDFTPPRPRLRTAGATSLTFDDPDVPLNIPVYVDWESGEDFNGPDVVEFRVAVSWIVSQEQSVRIVDVINVDSIYADLVADNIAASVDEYAGNRLSLPGGDYSIESHGSGVGASFRVRKPGSRLPDVPADGLIFYSENATKLTRVYKEERNSSVFASINRVTSVSPLQVELTVHDSGTVPSGDLRAYVHLFRGMVDMVSKGGGVYEVQEPDEATTIQANWDAWQGLSNASDALKGSPAIIYPEHLLSIPIIPPSYFDSGVLSLQVSAVDGADYIASPALAAADTSLTGLVGNESARSELLYTLRSTQPAATPTTPSFNPSVREWASSAANYSEYANYEVQWTAVSDATRFEVWRVMAECLSGVDGSTSDTELRTHAESQIEKFELRSEQVYGNSYTDEIPGRAPTRVLYYIKSVNASGVKSDPSSVIGPIYVPDIRQPSRPNLVRAAAASPEEADRAIKLLTTQSGPHADVRWDIYYRAADGNTSGSWAAAGSLPVGTTADSAGRRSFLHTDLPPGKKYQYKVVAVREALDPADTSAALTRDIESPASIIQVAAAISADGIGAPSTIAANSADSTAGSDIQLTWTNSDEYESIEIRRKEQNRYVYQTIATLAGDATEYVDVGVDAGAWTYVIRARGFNQVVNSDTSSEVILS